MTSFISLSGLIGNVIVISKFSAQRHLSEKRNLSASYPNTGVHKLIDKSHRWRKTAIAAATAAIFGLLGSNAAALSLGRITVQSALGEPLRAEIDIPSINAEEAASLQTVIASPEAFRAAGLEYSPAMPSLRATLERRSDGRFFVRLRSDRAVNEPFMDMILEASWASGRIVRDYTLLFDPPRVRENVAPEPTPAQVPTPARPSRMAPQGQALPPLPLPPARQNEPVSRTTEAPAQRPIAQSRQTNTGPIKVKSGDTASEIAAATKHVNVSLDQMLVAMLRANPAAFTGDNVNRFKAGAIINIPTEEQARATSATEATQIIVAQSKNFNDYRRKLAGSAPSTQVAAADRQASGQVQATVEDKQPVAVAPDKLTLSKGAVQATLAEDQLVKERSEREATNRAAEIAKNISDLGKLGVASGTISSPASPASADAAPELAVPAPAMAISAPAATVSAPKPAASTAVQKPTTTLAVTSPSGWLDSLLENRWLLAGAAALLALLAGLGVYRVRQRKKASQSDSAFGESRLHPDSFFGDSGGQSVDTSDTAANGSSLAYSPSQLDAVDDVDPVAEADVYLAYGRDLQAEEILKDALRTTPERIAIHQKLLEIFSKRRDTQGFETIAALAFKLTGGVGSDWENICELGLTIDPTNALYQPGGQLPDLTGSAAVAATATAAATAAAIAANVPDNVATPTPSQPPAQPVNSAVDLDLDLDFSLDEEPVNTIIQATASQEKQEPASEPVPATPVAEEPLAFDLDFALDAEQTPPAQEIATDSIEFSLPDLDIVEDKPAPSSVNDDTLKLQEIPDFDMPAPAAPEPEPTKAKAPDADLEMLEFDLGSLSLDLGDAPEPEAKPVPMTPEDPLATKLALAEEFRAIGDDDGARALIEEVIAEASGEMKTKALRALSNL